MAFLLIDPGTWRSPSTPLTFRAADTPHGPWISTSSVSRISLDGGREPVIAGGVQTRRLFQLSSMMMGSEETPCCEASQALCTRSTRL